VHNQGVGPGSDYNPLIGGAPRGAYDSHPSDWQKIGLVDYFNSGEGAVKIAGFTKSMNFSSGELSKHADAGYNRSAETVKKSGREIRTVEIYKEQLKVDSLKATGGWSALYNSDHTPKDSDSVYSYSNATTNRDNLKIGTSPFDPTGATNFSRGSEPYMVSKIGDRTWSTQEFSPGRAGADVKRIGKFLFSPAGIAFIAKQNLIPLMSKTVYGDIDSFGNPVIKQGSTIAKGFQQAYSPLSSPAAAAVHLAGAQPNALLERTFPFQGIGGRGFKETYEKWITDRIGYTINPSLGQKPKESKFRDPIVKNESSDGDAQTIFPIVDHEFFKGTEIGKEQEKSGLPFYFKDLRDNKVVVFRAFIDGITENVAPTWDTEEYIGRSEPVYTYGSTERDFSFNLKLWAQTSTELFHIYTKMNKLTSMCYPEYKEDQKFGVDTKNMTYNKMRMKPPLAEMRLGDLYGRNGRNMLGFISSISYTFPDETPWETKKGNRVPKAVDVAIEFQVIHRAAPGITTSINSGEVMTETTGEFYGYGHGSIQ